MQIGLELFIGKTTAETSGGNCQCRCNFYWPATRYHMPWAFRQRIGIRKRKLTTRRSTLMRHSFSYRDRLKSSNAEVAPLDEFIDEVMSILKTQTDVKEVCVKKVYPLRFSAEHGQQRYEEFFQNFNDTMHS